MPQLQNPLQNNSAVMDPQQDTMTIGDFLSQNNSVGSDEIMTIDDFNNGVSTPHQDTTPLQPEHKIGFIKGMAMNLFAGFEQGSADFQDFIGFDNIPYFKKGIENSRKIASDIYSVTKSDNWGIQEANKLAQSLGNLGSILPIDIITGSATKVSLAGRVLPKVEKLLSSIPDFALGSGWRGLFKGISESQAQGDNPIISDIKGINQAAADVALNTAFAHAGTGVKGITTMAAIGGAMASADAMGRGQLPSKEELSSGIAQGAAYGIIFTALPHIAEATKINSERITLESYDGEISKHVQNGDFDSVKSTIGNMLNDESIRPEIRNAIKEIAVDENGKPLEINPKENAPILQSESKTFGTEEEVNSYIQEVVSNGGEIVDIKQDPNNPDGFQVDVNILSEPKYKMSEYEKKMKDFKASTVNSNLPIVGQDIQVGSETYKVTKLNAGKTGDMIEAVDLGGRKQLFAAGQIKDVPKYKTADIFYSQVSKVIDEKMPNAATPEMIRGILSDKNGVKAEELKWIGLDDFLVGKQKVTKQELQDYIAQNKVQIKEVEKGQGNPVQWEQSKSDDGGRLFSTKVGNRDAIIREVTNPESSHEWVAIVGGTQREYFNDLNEAKNWADSFHPADETKFKSYQLPGGKNYRELLMTLPIKGKEETPYIPPKKITELPSEFTYIHDQSGIKSGKEWAIIPKDQPHGRSFTDWYYPTKEDALKAALEKINFNNETKAKAQWLRDNPPNKNAFQSGHFDESNILAHVRMNDRTDADGKKVLFVEEVQSDWHQKGRKEGYKDKQGLEEEKRRKELEAKLKSIEDEQIANDRKLRELNQMVGLSKEQEEELKFRENERKQLQAAFNSIQNDINYKRNNSVPDAPFKKTWHELAMKRMLRYAAENGYDKLAWTTGEHQAERYDLSKQIKQVTWNKENGQFIARPLNEGNDIVQANVKEQDLENLVGKETAKKLIDAEPTKLGNRTLNNVDLKVGGEGMKGFYDQILPSFMNKYAKKWGGRVGESRIQTKDSAIGAPNSKARLDTSTAKVHSIDITPSMKESVLNEGQPLFKEQPTWEELKINKVQIEALDKEGRALIRKYVPQLENAIVNVPFIYTKEGNRALGRYFKGEIAISSGANPSVYIHEAGHAVLDMFMTREERAELIKEAGGDEENIMLGLEKAVKKFEKGQEYKSDKWSSKVVSLFKKVYQRVKEFLNIDKSKIEKFYNDFISGEFENSKQIKDYKNEPSYKLSEDEIKAKLEKIKKDRQVDNNVKEPRYNYFSDADIKDIENLVDWESYQQSGGIIVSGGQQTGPDRIVIGSKSAHSEAMQKIGPKESFRLLEKARNGDKLTDKQMESVKLLLSDYRANIKNSIDAINKEIDNATAALTESEARAVNDAFAKEEKVAEYDLEGNVISTIPSEVSPFDNQQIEGTGKQKPRGLAMSTEESAIKDALTKGFGELPSYKTRNMDDIAAKVSEFINKNHELAMSIVNGEAPEQDGLRAQELFTGLKVKAEADGDVGTIRDLALSEHATATATELGQRIKALDSESPDDAVSAIRDVQDTRIKVAKDKLKKSYETEKKNIVKDINKEIKKSSPKIKDWNDFLTSLEC